MAHKKDAVWGGLISSIFFIPALMFFGDFSQEPYSDVTVYSFEQVSPGVYQLNSSFVKNDRCVFVKIAAFESVLGVERPVPFKTTDEDRGDTLAGQNSLNITMQASGGADGLSIRTRHTCDGDKADKIYWSIDLKDTPDA